MRTRHGRWQRGYALSEAMVGGVVLLFALGAVMSGFSQARGQVSRALSDQQAAQFGVAVIEQLRARRNGDPLWALGSRACTAIPDTTLPTEPPGAWTCTITVDEHTEFSGQTVGRRYLRARVTVGYRKKTWIMEALRW